MFGLALGAEVIQTVARLDWRKDAEIRAVQTLVPIPSASRATCRARRPSLGWGRARSLTRSTPTNAKSWKKSAAKRPVIPCEVQAIAVGDLGLVTNGAEFFCQLGLDIKAASPFDRTWVVSLANQWIGYVATPSAYYAGGYEPRTARSAKMAPWAGQPLVEGSLRCIAGCQQEAWLASVDRGHRFNSRLIHSSAARIARARVGQGMASQLGSPPWGAVWSWTHCWIICGDWLYVAARRTTPLPSGWTKITV